MKFLSLILFTFLFTNISYSQVVLDGQMTSQTQSAIYDIMNKSRNPVAIENGKIIGTPYYKESFSYGKIFLKKKELDLNYSFRYNAYTDEIEVNNGSDIDLLLKDTNISCIIDGERYSYQEYAIKEGKDIQFGYLKTIFQGEKTTLYLKKIKKFKEGKKAKTSLTASFPPKLVDFEEFYFSNYGETPHKLKLKNKELLAVIPLSFQLKMKTFLKGNDLNVNKKDDLITFFKYYDSLLLQNIN